MLTYLDSNIHLVDPQELLFILRGMILRDVPSSRPPDDMKFVYTNAKVGLVGSTGISLNATDQ